MTKYIAILRGINVGGKRRLKMDDLKALFRDLGFSDVHTYIQSGNVIFNASEKGSDTTISEKIEEAILQKYDFKVPVIVRTASELKEAIASNPFYTSGNEEVDRLHLTFLKIYPSAEGIEKARSANYDPDDFKVSGKNVFLSCSGKYSDSKLSNTFFESKLKVPATTRNWKTVLKLGELIDQ